MVKEVLSVGRSAQKIHLLSSTAEEIAAKAPATPGLPENSSSDQSMPQLSDLNVLRQSSSSNLATYVETLFERKAAGSTSQRIEAEKELIALIAANLDRLEAVHIAVQMTRGWSREHLPNNPTRFHFAQDIERKIKELVLSEDSSHNRDVRQILIRAFESPLLRDAAAVTISHILGASERTLLPEMRALASQVLTITRHITGFSALKRSASIVFTSTANIRSQGASPQPVRTPQAITNPLPAAAPVAAKIARAQALLKILTSDDGSKEVARLQPKDFQAIGGLAGLSLDQFRSICERLRFRAVTDQWPRAALLDLARAPHDAAVTGSVRTAMLGSLVAEARKCGLLSTELEQQVYATSAELPGLSHLETQPEAEYSTTENGEDPAAQVTWEGEASVQR